MRWALAFLGYVLAWVVTAVWWGSFIVLSLITAKRLTDRLFPPVAHAWGRALLRLVRVELRQLNPTTLQGRAPRVVVINHQSLLDGLWGATIVPPGALAIGKKEIIHIPVVNVLWWLLDFVRVDRSNRQKALESLRGVPQRIHEERRSLFIAPEGTRTRDGNIGPFKKGAFWLAMLSRAPIHPVVVSGAYESLPRTRLLPRPGVIRLMFLSPIDTRGWTHARLDEHIDDVRTRMVAAYESMRAQAAP